jgi:uncharacterized protein YijF (DUF1287 family)
MNILEHSTGLPLDEFKPGDLVTWHDQQGNKTLPIPAVVIRRAGSSILIKASVEGAMKEINVSPEEIVTR